MLSLSKFEQTPLNTYTQIIIKKNLREPLWLTDALLNTNIFSQRYTDLLTLKSTWFGIRTGPGPRGPPGNLGDING